jgi:peptidoglycan/LPS O-acetylase OafA/YrhL
MQNIKENLENKFLITMTEKITYLDGLRGIAAVNVMIMHFFMVLIPAMVYGNQTKSHLGNLELFFSGSPLDLIGAGDFSVCIFFVLSGLVLTQKYFKTKEIDVIKSSAFRRYPRLLIPVFATILLSFILSSLGIFHFYTETVKISSINNSANYWINYMTFTPNFVDAVQQALYNTFFVGGFIIYDPVLWTMNFEFFGSILVFSMAFLFGSRNNRWIFYLAAAIFLFRSYLLAFIIGMILSDMYSNNKPLFKISNKHIKWILLLSGLFLGSYPVSELPNDSIYRFLNNDLIQNSYIFYHIIGASLIMLVLLNSKRLQKLFYSSIPAFLGKISYSLYLLHFLVISSFTSAIFLVLYPILPYSAAVLTSIILSSCLIVPLSYLFYKYVDNSGIELSKIIYDKLFKNLKISTRRKNRKKSEINKV